MSDPKRFPVNQSTAFKPLGIMQGFPPPPDKRITLDNWDRPPFNRWSFQNVRSVLPTRAIARGTAPASAFGQAQQDILPIVFADIDGERRSVAEMLDRTYTDGFMVLRDGKIVAEHYLNSMTPASLHLSQSVSKSFVGAMVGILAGRGELNLNAELSHYVPELAATGYAGATLTQVLDMRSGVRFSEDYLDPNCEMGQLDRADGWKPGPRPGEPASTYDLILTLRQERPHGGYFQYRSIETDVLGWVLERVSGLGLAELMSRELWQPMGAESEACFTVDQAGTCLADGGLNATMRDYARFGQIFLDDGFLNGRQIVPAAWTAACRTGDVAAYQHLYRERRPTYPDACYSRQWWVYDFASGLHCASGVFGQLIYVRPRERIVAVKLSTWPDFLRDDLHASTMAALEAITLEIAR